MRTSLGLIEVVEQTYWDRRRGRELRPLSEACGVRARGYSRHLQRIITDFAADVPFERAAGKVAEHYGIQVPASSCRAIALGHAARVEAHLLPAAPARIAGQLIAEADGSMVPIVQIDECAPGDRRRARTVLWKEVKLGLVRHPDKVSPLVAATFGDPSACGQQWYDLAVAAGLGKATYVHALGDGAPWIADQVERQFGRQARYLVDFFHVCEYLAPVAAAGGDPASRWLETQKARLRNNQLPAVLKELERHFEPEEAADSPARICHRYLSARTDQLDYRSALERGLPVGSGEIESANRSVIQARMKRPGAWWKIHNAQNMINLQTLRHNGQWDPYWHSHLTAA